MVATFKENEMEALDISEDEFAKAHVRHLVGGRAEVKDERVFRFGMSLLSWTGLMAGKVRVGSRSAIRVGDVTGRRVSGRLTVAEFPERPNALGKFLNGLRKDLNISMFHYRNHGAGEFLALLYNRDIS